MIEVKRKLASIRRVAGIKPIDGADNIELLKIDGWNVVANKGIHKQNDLVIFFEIDSFLPVRPEFEFLRKSCFRSTQNLGDGFRLKTVKLRGQISQGLCLPLDILNGFGDYWKGIVPPNKWSNGTHCVNHEEGADCTEYLGVQKWEVPLPAQLAGDAKGNFPSFIRKTDQERCLSGDTLVDTVDGYKTIKEICDNKLNILVKSYNHTTNEHEFKPIIGWSSMTRRKGWIKIKTKSGKELIMTNNHRVWVDDLQCYRLASNLKIGDLLKI